MYNECDLCKQYDELEFKINDIGDWSLVGTHYVYVLLLEEMKFYVGCTKNIARRMYNHFQGGSSEWTKLYNPVAIIDLHILDEVNGTELYHLENMYTVYYMSKYRRSNVRGGDWTSRYPLSDKLHRSIDKYERQLANIIL